MSSPSREPEAETVPAGESVGPLLGVAFGLFVWMGHLLIIYIAAAVACGLGVVGAGGESPASLLTALVVVTVVAAAVVVLHGVRRWRRQRDVPDARFRITVTVGCDAIATVGIVWQLLAIGLVPACA